MEVQKKYIPSAAMAPGCFHFHSDVASGVLCWSYVPPNLTERLLCGWVGNTSQKRMTFECFSHRARRARWWCEDACYVPTKGIGRYWSNQTNEKRSEGVKTCAVFLVQEQRIHPQRGNDDDDDDTRYPGRRTHKRVYFGGW